MTSNQPSSGFTPINELLNNSSNQQGHQPPPIHDSNPDDDMKLVNEIIRDARQNNPSTPTPNSMENSYGQNMPPGQFSQEQRPLPEHTSHDPNHMPPPQVYNN